MGLLAAIALVMGSMIGAGVFLLPASLAPFGWNAVGAWIIAICGTLVLATVLARLVEAHPDAGGAVGIVDVAFGDVPAFLVSWVYLISNLTGMVIIAVAAVSYMASLVPIMLEAPLAVVAAVIWAIVLLNLRGLRAAGRFQTATTVIKIIPLIAVISLAVGALAEQKGAIAPFHPSALSLDGLGGAAGLTMFALLGFETVGFAAGRVRDPAKTVPRALLWGTALTGVFYLLVSSAISLMLPSQVVSASGAPFAVFVGHFWGTGPAQLISIFAVVSCVGALNGWSSVSVPAPRR
ncbi:APC family permease [Novosphingobium sp. Gsoil 351]|uniref:APC family permease n=1 Tax=Novosphingobium sp. Gsoil 351 TaxID=2675225 RepID=UPI0012B45257|nr:amino acid permease [Novosphingobium sp. Gsoil 351]QGN53458.1 amino acid permease [Novosphingobium sp. Gsoil 351]